MATLYYRPYTSEPVQDGEMPPHDALESILPEYKYIFVDPDGRRKAPGQNAPDFSRNPDDLDKGSIHLLDYQMRELEKYRTAVHKMGQDILTLRQSMRDLESHNSQLRRDLSKYNDSTKLLLDSQELDGLSKPELAARYVALKQKLTNQTVEMRDYKQRVQSLQNDLIKKNDQEKDLLRMSEAHVSQNETLHRLQDRALKVKRLEAACRKQEKVIEKMERLMSKGGKDRDSQANEALMEENRRLRSELEDHREANRFLSNGRDDAREEEEKLEMMERMEKAEGRIHSLEKQLVDNARQWGREKSDLLAKLQESEMGLQRTSPLDYPKIGTTRSLDPGSSRRYSKAPPRKPALAFNSSTSKYDPFAY